MHSAALLRAAVSQMRQAISTTRNHFQDCVFFLSVQRDRDVLFPDRKHDLVSPSLFVCQLLCVYIIMSFQAPDSEIHILLVAAADSDITPQRVKQTREASFLSV